MHSRIFQVSQEPIAQEDLMNEYSIPEYFHNGVANYVAEVSDQEAELAYFIESEAGILEAGKEKHTFRLAPQGRENYFRDNYKQFRELCALMLTASLGAFIGTEPGPANQQFSYLMYKLNDSYRDHYGYYIFERDELKPFCDWLREANAEAVYYLGNVLDYHF